MELLKNYLISIVRTAVPFIVGNILSWLATRNITLDMHMQFFLTQTVAAALGLLYYAVIRALEFVNHRWGWLLGYAKMPTYTVVPTISTTVAPDSGSRAVE